MLSVRPIAENDASEFSEVLASVCRERRFLAILVPPSAEEVLTFLKANLRADVPKFVAVLDGKIVGWCDAIPGDASIGTGHVVRLGMGVLKEFRSRGIGKQLLRATIEKARVRGFEKIELGVFSSNEPAIALYRRLGFREEGRKLRGRLVDGAHDDVVLMALDLQTPNKAPEPTPGLVTPRALE